VAQNKRNILIVDDDLDLLRSLADYFALKAYAVETAKTGKEAIEKSKNHFFNLAVLDIRLPDMEGTSLLTKMSETEPKMKKIMLTGYANIENAVESVNKRADAYVIKPADPKKLLELVEEKLAEQEQELKMDRKRLTMYIESRDKQFDRTGTTCQ
jgi:DNA-binding NtrC family response regulator